MGDEVIYFVSDTHLGDGSGADRFRYPRQLMELLQRIGAEPNAQLVLLGDFMELWAASLEAVLVRHAPIFHAIGRLAERIPVTYVVGNHDCLPWYYFVNEGTGNIRVTDKFTALRGSLVAIHGHQYDPFNQVKMLEQGKVKVPWTSKLVQVLGLLERVGGDAAGTAIANTGELLLKAASQLDKILPEWGEAQRNHFGQLLHRTKDVLDRQSPGERGYPLGETAYAEGARGLMRAGARVVIMGHTHHPLTQTYGTRVYVNTGSWVWDRYPPTYARYAQGSLALLNADTHQPYAPPASP